MNRLLLITLASTLLAPLAGAQDMAPVPADQERHPVATFHVDVVARTTEAINYRYRQGATHVNFTGTDLMPKVEGKARVQSAAGKMDIEARVEHLQPAEKFGPEYLTYVLWAITPEGRAVNLGELIDRDGHADVHTAVDLQAFGLIVTAEPYFAVTRPSSLIVAQNVVRPDTEGWAEHIDAKFEALEGGSYVPAMNPAELPASKADRKKTPLQLLEAENAVAIAKAAGAGQYAADVMTKAETRLEQAQSYREEKQHSKVVSTPARQATELAEDARVLSLRHQQEERAAAERQALQQQAEQAKTEAQLEQERAERERTAAERARMEAQSAQQQASQAQQEAAMQRQQAEAAAQQAALQRQQADAALAAAQQQQQQLQQQASEAQAEADRARKTAQEAERDREQMRARLVAQLNQVLQTRDTAQGVIVTMPDVLFAFNQATLKPTARERLAKVAGIVLAYPDIKLNVEGFTDAIGSEQYNQTLSEKRAAAVRDYLISQGVNVNHVMAEGFGKSNPVASNATPQGRQLNRRVELVVTGESIGQYVAPGSSEQPANGMALPQSGQRPPLF
ncbi:MAG: OmpA family protein [Acidobacteria bacterium]|nr:OmpA family protein [Acidobacteriota bacterium]